VVRSLKEYPKDFSEETIKTLKIINRSEDTRAVVLLRKLGFKLGDSFTEVELFKRIKEYIHKLGIDDVNEELLGDIYMVVANSNVVETSHRIVGDKKL